uniref:Uncharacterized protein LOC104236306 n=1 Tax=Nicotiana sylvestris TaxID=4096 RepID=A0A1U7XPU0_NICSY|nr:PREDICTED: uncharacterized protein LOC104236306 [Nicotiana sylvestris]
MAPYEALYMVRCRSLVGWFEPREVRLLGTNQVCDDLEKVKFIQEQLRTSQSSKKSYIDRKDRNVAYIVGEKVLLIVSPMKGMMRVCWFGPGKILEGVGTLDFILESYVIGVDQALTYV